MHPLLLKASFCRSWTLQACHDSSNSLWFVSFSLGMDSFEYVLVAQRGTKRSAFHLCNCLAALLFAGFEIPGILGLCSFNSLLGGSLQHKPLNSRWRRFVTFKACFAKDTEWLPVLVTGYTSIVLKLRRETMERRSHNFCL